MFFQKIGQDPDVRVDKVFVLGDVQPKRVIRLKKNMLTGYS